MYGRHGRLQCRSADALVDGLCGADNFRSGRLVGFLGGPCDVTITLPEPTEISQVGFKTCIVWPEGALEMSRAEVYGSADGKVKIYFNLLIYNEGAPALARLRFFVFTTADS